MLTPGVEGIESFETLALIHSLVTSVRNCYLWTAAEVQGVCFVKSKKRKTAEKNEQYSHAEILQLLSIKQALSESHAHLSTIQFCKHFAASGIILTNSQ